MRALLVALCISSLLACSSPRGRAPVSDVTLALSGKVASTPVYSTQGPTKKDKIWWKTYKVKKGDTLYSIGWRSGIAVDDLIKLNNLKKPYIIKVGQIVKLKTNSPQKTPVKRDPDPQMATKKSDAGCITQNCQKKVHKKVAPKKTKAYSNSTVSKKTSKTNAAEVAVKKPKNNKVGDWSWPVIGKLTKVFSDSPSGMQGISLTAPQGSAIYSTAAGQVVYAGNGLRGYGNLIIIKHNYDYLSAYAHNDTLLVRENEFIKKGQKISTMGESGTDHVHLHFEIRYRGKSVDPLRYLPKR